MFSITPISTRRATSPQSKHIDAKGGPRRGLEASHDLFVFTASSENNLSDLVTAAAGLARLKITLV